MSVVIRSSGLLVNWLTKSVSGARWPSGGFRATATFAGTSCEVENGTSDRVPKRVLSLPTLSIGFKVPRHAAVNS